MKVLAAVVTYNRSQLLARCIDALRAQTRTPDHILIINNSSPDDTEAMLRARGVDFITQPNVGGAGGFHRAIAYAEEQGFEGVWLMDDDGYPGRRALECLTSRMGPGIASVSSVVLRENDPNAFVFPYPVLDRDGFPAIFAWPRKIRTLSGLRSRAPEGTFPYAHFFNGCLISTDAIRAVGNVDPRFFIYGDEVDYRMRLRRVGRNLSDVAAHHYHPDVTTRPLSEAGFYYFVKNTLILNRRYLNKVLLRNLLAVGVALGRTASRNGWGMALSYLVGRRATMLWRAVIRGLNGDVGPDYPTARQRRAAKSLQNCS